MTSTNDLEHQRRARFGGEVGWGDHTVTLDHSSRGAEEVASSGFGCQSTGVD
jgi:hypothetical protein